MNGASPDLLLELVRLTARTSAVIFVASLTAGAAELVGPQSSFSRRGAGWKLLGALLASHTIHFATVFALTVQTHGPNVAARGGWVLATIVGLTFYAATGGAFVLRRTPSAARGRRPHCPSIRGLRSGPQNGSLAQRPSGRTTASSRRRGT